MNIDYDIARAIVDELLPYSLEYYLGVRGENKTDLFGKEEDEEKDKDEEAEAEEVKRAIYFLIIYIFLYCIQLF